MKLKHISLCHYTLSVAVMAEESNARLAYDRISALLKDQASSLDPGVDFRTNDSFSRGEVNTTGMRGSRGASVTQGDVSFSFGASFMGHETRREETLNDEEAFGGDSVFSSESEEEHFHSSLAAFLCQTEHDPNELVGVRMEHKDLQAEISSDYSVKAGLSHEEAVRRLHSVDTAMQDVPSMSSNDQGSRSGEAMRKRKQEEVSETRAERDMWALLDILSRAELLVKINDDECAQKATEAIASLAPDTLSAEVHNAVLHADLRVKKGRVLCEWLEFAARDLVQELPELDEPWERTLNSHARFSGEDHSGSAVESAHPDAQLSRDTALLGLEEGDYREQELLLRALWQLIRSGQVATAQQVAWNARVFWLASSLSGVASHYYEAESLSGGAPGAPEESMDVDAETKAVLRVPSRRGNVRRPLWLRTCWLYSDKLAANSVNWKCVRSNRSRADMDDIDVGMNAMYEMTIYAALSNNTRVSLKSPCISSWSDRMWVLTKAVHERDISSALRTHRDRKMRHSQLYPECQPALVEADSALNRLGEEAGLASLGVASDKGLNGLLALTGLPSSDVRGDKIDAEAVILQLQAAIILGPDGLNAFLRSHVAPILATCADFYRTFSPSATRVGPLLLTPFPGSSRLLRVFAHLVIWLRYSNEDAPCDLQRELSNLTDSLFYAAIEGYIEYLIFTKRSTLVARYACFLSRSRRVQAYTRLLISMPALATEATTDTSRAEGVAPGLDHPEAVQILQLARQSFCADDVKQIVTAYAQASREGTGRSPLFSATISSTEENEEEKKEGESVANASSALAEEEETADAQSIDSLKWLFIDPSHRLEAVNQTNRLIVRLLCNERSLRHGHKDFPLASCRGPKISLVNLLLSPSHFPDDSEAIGTGMLRDLKHQVENDMASNEGDPEVLEAEMQELLLQEAQWGVNWRQLQFWRSFLATMGDTEHFHTTLAKFKDTSTTGGAGAGVSHRAQIERSAENVINGVLRTVTGKQQREDTTEEPGHEDWLASTGCMEIWHDAEAVAVRTARHAVDVFLAETKQNAHDLRQQSSAGYTDLVPCAELRDKLTSLEAIATRLFDPSVALRGCAATVAPTGPTGQGPSVVSRQLELLHMVRSLLFDVIAAVETCDDSEGKVDKRYHLNVAIEKIAESLRFAEECRVLSVNVVLCLLHIYLRVCLEAGAALERIELPSFAHQWFASGVRLAAVLADSHPALQLSLCLPTPEIERLLTDINACSLKSVDLRGVFDLTNE